MQYQLLYNCNIIIGTGYLVRSTSLIVYLPAGSPADTVTVTHPCVVAVANPSRHIASGDAALRNAAPRAVRFLYGDPLHRDWQTEESQGPGYLRRLGAGCRTLSAANHSAPFCAARGLSSVGWWWEGATALQQPTCNVFACIFPAVSIRPGSRRRGACLRQLR